MDSNKSATAPGWDNEKSSMVQNPPPPYYDNPGAVPPGQAYPPQGYGCPPQQGAMYNQQVYSPGQQYPGQPAPVIMQPTMYVTQGPLTNPVNDYMGYSIFTMLCCCLPLGIAALIYSISAREANHTGDQMSAERNSRTAKTLNHVALGLGLGSFVLGIIYVVVVVVVASAH
ncbi:PREDICTED: proline-rich transmembrane protein 1-like [Poecilia mexicana]|uniref:proline-rich transmembrane protein 1-like n=1 Tax=Poecilia formosa TaxID=48698 RepID=UPI00044441FE|nr:PREDICTED: proline-rich transmembrane protein 1-like [Poecilia formosa]XP_014860658.1 PREDICTED: proline-rich transmembrane protein 1-like [Poecilia mexicana]